MAFKWFTMGGEGDEMHFIVEDGFDVRRAMLGTMSEPELADAVVAQAQTEKWAATITAALNYVKPAHG